MPREFSASEVDGCPRLPLIRVIPVSRQEIAERHDERPVLHLPDVAELVHDEILRQVRAAQKDRPMHGVAVEAAEPRQAEEPRSDEHTNAIDPYRLRVPVEPVEPRLGSGEIRGAQPVDGSSTRMNAPSCAWVTVQSNVCGTATARTACISVELIRPMLGTSSASVLT